MPDTDADTMVDVGTEQDTVNGVRVLLRVSTTGKDLEQDPFAWEQSQDPAVKEIIDFLESGTLPEDATRARKLSLQESLFTLVNGILYFIDPKHKNQKRTVVPRHLRKQILRETHSGSYGGHFSGQRLYNTLMTHWWWGGMFNDAVRFAKACPECVVATGNGRKLKPPLHPIPVSRD